MASGNCLQEPISLHRLLPGVKPIGVKDIRVTDCACHPDEVHPGSLFFAIGGGDLPPDRVAVAAAAKGAAAVVAEVPLPDLQVPVLQVSDVRTAYGHACHSLAGRPSRRLRTIGITGTRGKTVTSWLIASVLAEGGYLAGVIGSLGSFDGHHVLDCRQTTPPPQELAWRLWQMVGNRCHHAVIEASSRALAESRLAGIDLDAVCVTNIRREHIDLHGSVSAYRQAKASVFQYLSEQGFVVLNADDPVSMQWLRRLDVPALTFGIGKPAEISAQIVERCLHEQTFLLSAGNEVVPVHTRMIGTQHVYNCLGAAAIGLAYGIPLAAVARGLEAVESLPGRLERIECGQPFGVFVEHAETPGAVEAALQALRPLVKKRLICVFSPLASVRREQAAWGRTVAAHADVGVLAQENIDGEQPASAVRAVLKGFREPERLVPVGKRVDAIAWALSHAQPHDCVLIVGRPPAADSQCGGPSYAPDAETARRWLYENKPFSPAAVN